MIALARYEVIAEKSIGLLICPSLGNEQVTG